MFTLPDYLAAIIGSILGAYAFFRSPKGHDGSVFLFAFGSGASACYLFVMAYALMCDQALLTSTMKTNPTTVFGALLYAGVINLRSLKPLVLPNS